MKQVAKLPGGGPRKVRGRLVVRGLGCLGDAVPCRRLETVGGWGGFGKLPRDGLARCGRCCVGPRRRCVVARFGRGFETASDAGRDSSERGWGELEEGQSEAVSVPTRCAVDPSDQRVGVNPLGRLVLRGEREQNAHEVAVSQIAGDLDAKPTLAEVDNVSGDFSEAGGEDRAHGVRHARGCPSLGAWLGRGSHRGVRRSDVPREVGVTTTLHSSIIRLGEPTRPHAERSALRGFLPLSGGLRARARARCQPLSSARLVEAFRRAPRHPSAARPLLWRGTGRRRRTGRSRVRPR